VSRPTSFRARRLRRWLAVLGALALVPAGPAPAQSAPPPPPAAAQAPWFRDVAAAAGVAAAHHERRFDNPYARIMEGYTALGAAAAVADYDGDGLDDLYVTDSAEDSRNHLYRNLGGFRFEDVAGAAGVARGNDAGDASADALWLDYDGDGDPDLFVVRFGRSLLFRNDGDGTFTDVTESAGLDRYANSITAIAFDYDLDGDVDLFVGNYFRPVDIFHPDTPRFFPDSFETAENGGGLTLWRNDGDGTFTDATAAAGLAGDTGWTLDLGHGDADGDGDDDLYVASDFGTDHFFANDGDGTFTDVTRGTIGIDTKKGMNAEWGDFDADGRLDVFVTNITSEYMREGNFLWHNDSGPAGPDGAPRIAFSDVAAETGTADTGWGWGGKFFDYDNDGWLDLYVADGWVSAGPQSYVVDIFDLIVRSSEDDTIDLSDARNWPPMGTKSLSGYEHNVLFHNQGGALFRDEAKRHGVDSVRDARGVVVADFDGDGRQDLFVTNAGAAPNLYRNVAPAGPHWIELLLGQPGANRQAVGARVHLTAPALGTPPTRLAFVDGGNGFAGQSARRVHFGLASAKSVERLEIDWPEGGRTAYEGLPTDRVYRIERDEPVSQPAGKASR
jgi:hypothetical protein